ncbi:YdiY family protein [Qipengyuania sp. R86523]|uniref:YdiY family protein n=1 Tax=Qipengyuania sp. R86523 TaxID=3093862 RepID=UPI0037CC9E2F
MIDAAIASGDERKVATVIGLARSTWPEERSTIDAINDQWKITLAARRAAEAEAEQTALINAGMFDRWSGEGELGAFQSSGNTELVGVAAALRLDREGIDWTHSIRLRADYQRQNGSTSREQFAASYEPRWQFDENIFAYGLAQYERDRIQGFSSRYSVSGGFGYRVIDNPKLKLSLKAGPAYRVTDFTDGTSADRLAELVGLDFDWQMLDRLKLTQDVEALAETGGEATLIFDGANTTINLVTGLDFRVSNRLRSRLSYKVEYDSNPPAGSEGTDTLTRATLIYGF